MFLHHQGSRLLELDHQLYSLLDFQLYFFHFSVEFSSSLYLWIITGIVWDIAQSCNLINTVNVYQFLLLVLILKISICREKACLIYTYILPFWIMIKKCTTWQQDLLCQGIIVVKWQRSQVYTHWFDFILVADASWFSYIYIFYFWKTSLHCSSYLKYSFL